MEVVMNTDTRGSTTPLQRAKTNSKHCKRAWSLAEQRCRMSALQAPFQPYHQGIQEIQLTDSKNREHYTVKCYRPEPNNHTADTTYATIIYIPGTAFIANEQSYTHAIAHILAQYSKCQVIVVRPLLAPEHKFPDNIYDMNRQLSLIVNRYHKKLKIDRSNVVLAGYSSGGTYAAALNTLFSSNKKSFAVKHQVLFAPLLNLSRRSKRDFDPNEQKDIVLTTQFLKKILDAYLPSNIDPKQPLASPLFTATEQLKQLPPTDILIGEFDRCKSDANSYAALLNKSQIPVRCIEVDGGNHGFMWKNYKALSNYAHILGHTLNMPIPKLFSLNFKKSLSPTKQQRPILAEKITATNKDISSCPSSIPPKIKQEGHFYPMHLKHLFLKVSL